jgi:hypothetical protein
MEPNEQPPLFRKWTAWYTLVVAVLVLQAILYYLFTKRFS